jgi:hypothetical protein
MTCLSTDADATATMNIQDGDKCGAVVTTESDCDSNGNPAVFPSATRLLTLVCVNVRNNNTTTNMTTTIDARDDANTLLNPTFSCLPTFLQGKRPCTGLWRASMDVMRDILNMNNGDSNSNRVGDSAPQQQQHNNIHHYLGAQERVQRTLESLEKTFSILDAMLSHPQRRNGCAILLEQEAEAGSTLSFEFEFERDATKQYAILIAGSSFDFCTLGQLDRLHRKFDNLKMATAQRRATSTAASSGCFPPTRMSMSMPMPVPASSSFSTGSAEASAHSSEYAAGAPPTRKRPRNNILVCAQAQAHGQKIDDQVLSPLYTRILHSTHQQEQRVHHIRHKLQTHLAGLQHHHHHNPPQCCWRDCTFSVFGSSLSKLSLFGSDVDLSLEHPSLKHELERLRKGEVTKEEHQRAIKRLIYTVTNQVAQCEGIIDVRPVANARVPVVKGTAMLGGTRSGQTVRFDISFENHRAVANSFLLKQYVELDPKVKILMMLIKTWLARHASNIGSAAHGTLSAYSWMNLVVFYLQTIGFVPNLQCPHLIQQHAHTHMDMDDARPSASVMGLDTNHVTAQALLKSKLWRRSDELQNISITELLVSLHFRIIIHHLFPSIPFSFISNSSFPFLLV